MPKTEKINRQLRDDRKEMILAAAIAVFARKGLASTQIGDLAKEAKISLKLLLLTALTMASSILSFPPKILFS